MNADTDLASLFDAVEQLAARIYPHHAGAVVRIRLPSGLVADISRENARDVIADAQVPFIANGFQSRILDALEGRALRTDALGNAADDRRRLYRDPGGLKELQAHGLVKWHKRIGYYRPDAPPACLADMLPVSATTGAPNGQLH